MAVYHLASREVGTDKLTGIPPVLDDVGIQNLPHAKVAVIDDIKLSPSQSRQCDGVTVNTLGGGDLAYLLLGVEGYQIVADSVADGTSPGKEVLTELIRKAAPLRGTDALTTQGEITCHFGHYLPMDKQFRIYGAIWTCHKEKMTDVNIATQLLADAYDDHYDTAFVVSGDSDLTTPVRQFRIRFPNKRLIIAFPPTQCSAELKKAAHGPFVIDVDKMR